MVCFSITKKHGTINNHSTCFLYPPLFLLCDSHTIIEIIPQFYRAATKKLFSSLNLSLVVLPPLPHNKPVKIRKNPVRKGIETRGTAPPPVQKNSHFCKLLHLHSEKGMGGKIQLLESEALPVSPVVSLHKKGGINSLFRNSCRLIPQWR